MDRHLQNRSVKAKEKYAESLFSLVNYLRVSWLVLFAAPLVRLGDIYFTDHKKYCEALVLFKSAYIFMTLFWFLLLLVLYCFTKDIENKAMKLCDIPEKKIRRKLKSK